MHDGSEGGKPRRIADASYLQREETGLRVWPFLIIVAFFFSFIVCVIMETQGCPSTRTHPKKKVRVRLILPGGGVKGTFQVGFIQAMQRSDKYEIDHVYGTSVGALIAPFAVCGRIDRVADHFASLRSINDIVDEWPWYIRMLPTSIRVLFKLGAFRSIKLADQIGYMD